MNKAKLFKTEETQSYLVIYNPHKEKWELRRKVAERTLFIKSCQFKTPLLVAAKSLEQANV